MKTKDRILGVALDLFNRFGHEPITVRDMAKELKISHGNLCYHFPRKEDVIWQLYQNLVSELDQVIANPDLDLNRMIDFFKAIYIIQYKYRFILQDFVAVMRLEEKIRKHFLELQKIRRAQFDYIISQLRSAGLLREDLPKDIWDYLFSQQFLVGDFWLARVTILDEGKEQEYIDYYAKLSSAMLVPYLSEKGLKALKY